MAAPQTMSTVPIVMRWIETVPAGQRHWYLAALRPDASFWGYVHVRTITLNENRSFEGQLDPAEHRRIQSLIESVGGSELGIGETGIIDGLIGLGSRSDFTPIIQYNAESSKMPNAEIFQEIVDILQPVVNSAARLNEY